MFLIAALVCTPPGLGIEDGRRVLRRRAAAKLLRAAEGFDQARELFTRSRAVAELERGA